MRRYLLDTGILVAYLQGKPTIVQLVSPFITGQEAATSIVVYAEVVEHFKSFPEFAPGNANCNGCFVLSPPTFSPTPFLSATLISDEASESRMEKGSLGILIP